MIISDLVLLIMSKLFSVLIVTILLLQLSVAQRISEKKCREYSEIRSANFYPHMVWIQEAGEERKFNVSIGVLISDQYILTSSLSNLIVNKSQVYFTKDVEIEGNFLQKINIVEKHTHPLYNETEDTIHYDIALLKLERKVKLDGNHRPACLWTNEKIDDTEAFMMALLPLFDEGYDFSKLTEQLLIESTCEALVYKHNFPLLCTLPLYTKAIGDPENELQPARGSPIQVKKTGFYIPNNHYILGIFSRHDFLYNRLNVGSKTYVHLDWIENIVWPSRNTNCGKVKVQHRGFNLFGSQTFLGEFPWHAALYKKQGSGVRKYLCGGILLNKNTILTAAHCLHDGEGKISPNLLIVSLGTYDLDKTNVDSREIRVSQVIRHENFTRYNENDIALLKLADLISFSNYIEPICLTNDLSIFPSQIGVVAGWGEKENNILQNVILKTSLPIVSNDDCYIGNRGEFKRYLNDRNFCTVFGNNGTNACFDDAADSGGGLVFENDGNWYVRGIVSLGVRCRIVVFTDVTKFYDWIVNRL